MVHNGSMMKVIIPVNCFIIFYSALVQYIAPSWYIAKRFYHTNTRSFFSVLEKYYHNFSKFTPLIFSGQICSADECSICKIIHLE